MRVTVKVWRIPGLTSSSVGSNSAGIVEVVVTVVLCWWWLWVGGWVVVVSSGTSKEKCLGEKVSDWACEDKFNILYFPRSFFYTRLFHPNCAIIGFNAPTCFGCQPQPSSGSYSWSRVQRAVQVANINVQYLYILVSVCEYTLLSKS